VFLFLLGFLGLGVSIWPWIVPHKLTIWDCLGVIPSLEITFIGVAIMLPIVLVYTGFNYYLFRGKVSSKSMYE
jgi:cytochrome d ubiquinol oxidase subunit II